ncbi:MAG TPA: hypothetical protein VD968_04150 [Pyrinomonadaceae bacterium]|nr:hypothetical protein [Pyrinomonadaceae bacterium]
MFLGPSFFARLPLFSGISVSAPARHERPSARRARPNAAAEAARARIKEARRLLEASPARSTDAVTLAVEGGSGVHLLRLRKEEFLREGGETVAVSSLGETLRVSVVRPNYVNTSVRVTGAGGRELRPLLVQYPIERNGALSEVAYYASAHPAASSDATARAGGEYVRTMLDEAAARLAGKGKTISPDVVDVAERLCFVEHADHKRFMTEDRGALFSEIQTLYALNAGDTYRYSVSSAGAGGMVQMIPSTYDMVRRLHPSAGLKEDFVEGMRDHSNALEAMLLYMQGTWDDLLRSEDVVAALSTGTATQAELLAAGYNSNPARLPRYLRAGGDAWRQLIPSETQMYLRIYASVESLVGFEDRS